MNSRMENVNRRWVIAQRWSHVQFLSARCDAGLLGEHLPSGLELDQFDGSPWMSVVPFYMSHIRFPFTPAVPWVNLWELNLRTYVRYQGRPGVFFVTLDTDSRLGQLIANRFFHLPYRYRAMTGSIESGHYHFNAPGSFSMTSQVGQSVASDALDRWLVERYHLYTSDGASLYRGDVAHRPWDLHEVEDLEWDDQFSPQFGFSPLTDVRVRYAEPIDVRFQPFVKIGESCR